MRTYPQESGCERKTRWYDPQGLQAEGKSSGRVIVELKKEAEREWSGRVIVREIEENVVIESRR